MVNLVAGLGQLYHFGLMIWLVPQWGYIGAVWHGVIATSLLVVTMTIALRLTNSWPDWRSVVSDGAKVFLLIIAAGLSVGASTP